jgi:hypothetical protein
METPLRSRSVTGYAIIYSIRSIIFIFPMNGFQHYRNLLATRRGGSLEALTGESSGSLDKDDILHRVAEVMKNIPPREIGNPDEYRRALSIFIQHADETLTKLDRGGSEPAVAGDHLALEAVVRLDGTRPSLLVRNDTIDPEHPLAGGWRDTLYSIRDSIRRRAAAVGRIEPANASPNRFFGTGWLVDSGKGLVITNLHVLEEMFNSVPESMVAASRGFKVNNDAVFVDFAGEDGSLIKKRFRVVEATPSPVDGKKFARLDVAVLRIEAIQNESPQMPEAIPVVADLSGPTGSMPSFCVVGFPGKPELTAGVVDGVDWDWITSTLFGNRFGVKRLAPGTAHKPLGTIGGDTRRWVFGHDATTLAGSSGSAVLAWKDSNRAGFGLHFAGTTADTNYAHALAQCREQLRTLGVPVQEPA